MTVTINVIFITAFATRHLFTFSRMVGNNTIHKCRSLDLKDILSTISSEYAKKKFTVLAKKEMQCLLI